MTHIAVGGVVGAVGAVVAGLVLVALRMFLNRRARASQIARIRAIGIVAATKQALFDEREPELHFPERRREKARHAAY